MALATQHLASFRNDAVTVAVQYDDVTLVVLGVVVAGGAGAAPTWLSLTDAVTSASTVITVPSGGLTALLPAGFSMAPLAPLSGLLPAPLGGRLTLRARCPA